MSISGCNSIACSRKGSSATISPLFSRGYTVIPEPQRVRLKNKDFSFGEGSVASDGYKSSDKPEDHGRGIIPKLRAEGSNVCVFAGSTPDGMLAKAKPVAEADRLRFWMAVGRTLHRSVSPVLPSAKPVRKWRNQMKGQLRRIDMASEQLTAVSAALDTLARRIEGICNSVLSSAAATPRPQLPARASSTLPGRASNATVRSGPDNSTRGNRKGESCAGGRHEGSRTCGGRCRRRSGRNAG